MQADDLIRQPASGLPPSPEWKATKPSPQPPAAAPKPSKDPERRLCEGLLPRLSGSSSKPEQPEPPRMQPLSRPHGTPTGSGGIAALAIPPGAREVALLRNERCQRLR